MTPLVTIAIPVRNGADYLGQAIDSALAQTYPELEVLVVNDGSDDGGATEAVARRYGDRVRYLAQDNRGVAGALNTALRAMSGEVFSWLSHDDLFEPHKTALQAAQHQRAGGRADLALFSDFSWIDAQGSVVGEERAPHAELVANPMLAFYDGRINGCTVFAPRDLMIAVGGFDERLRHVQDYAAWRALVRRGALLHMPELLVRTRVHDAQGSRSREAALETEPFWSETLAEVGEVEAALVHGGREMLLRRTSAFLRYRSPNRGVSEEVRRWAGAVARKTLVSVVLDAHDDPEAVRRSAASVLGQSHARLELIVTGAEGVLQSPELADLRADARVVFAPAGGGQGSRLQQASRLAAGAYIALLNGGDSFAPEKLSVQLRAMSAAGRVWSHTTYVVEGDGGEAARAGVFSGRVYPEILGDCPVALSTVMIHRALAASGLAFADPQAPAALTWIELAARHPLLGIDTPLATLARPPTREDAALVPRLRADPLHARHTPELERLEARVTPTRFEPQGKP